MVKIKTVLFLFPFENYTVTRHLFPKNNHISFAN